MEILVGDLCLLLDCFLVNHWKYGDMGGSIMIARKFCLFLIGNCFCLYPFG